MEQTIKADGSILLEILKDQSRLVTDGIEPKYLSDTLGRLTGNADALVFPVSTEEVSAILRYAHEITIFRLRPGGGNQSCRLYRSGEGRHHIGPVPYEPHSGAKIRITFTATVESGVLLQDLQAYVERVGLIYPPDPGEKASTIQATSVPMQAACGR